MSENLKLMCVLAHPDDESLGTGGVLAKYASEGIETHLVTATRGQRGWLGPWKIYPGLKALGKIREAELQNAARELGIHRVYLLDYVDGQLDQADAKDAIAQIVGHLRRVQPQVVVTFDQYGAYGHPDHIAICAYTTAAIMAAADPCYLDTDGNQPHNVSKLYYLALTGPMIKAFAQAFGEVVITVNGEERRPVAWPEWAITTTVDTSLYWDRVWAAISCHRTQLPAYQRLNALPEEHHRAMWGSQSFYRACSLVNGAANREKDLFEGLRPHDSGMVAASTRVQRADQ
jgi:LmbE family N-acetylglucosaminyl deacetylase